MVVAHPLPPIATLSIQETRVSDRSKYRDNDDARDFQEPDDRAGTSPEGHLASGRGKKDEAGEVDMGEGFSE